MNYLFGFRNSRGFSQILATNSANLQVVFHSQKTFAKFRYNFCKIEHTQLLQIGNLLKNWWKNHFQKSVLAWCHGAR